MSNNLQCVIDWLEAGCDPKAAAEELRAIAALAQPAIGPATDITEMFNLESMTPVDGYDEIYKHYSTTFGRTPDAFMQKVVGETKERLMMWWGAHREAIRVALVTHESAALAQPVQTAPQYSVMKQAIYALEGLLWVAGCDESQQSRDAKQDADSALNILKEEIAQPVQPAVQIGEEPECTTHPDAPHGFDRNGSHNNRRYTCDCEGWEPAIKETPHG